MITIEAKKVATRVIATVKVGIGTVAFYFCCAIVEEKGHFISSKPAGWPAAPWA